MATFHVGERVRVGIISCDGVVASMQNGSTQFPITVRLDDGRRMDVAEWYLESRDPSLGFTNHDGEMPPGC